MRNNMNTDMDITIPVPYAMFLAISMPSCCHSTNISPGNGVFELRMEWVGQSKDKPVADGHYGE